MPISFKELVGKFSFTIPFLTPEQIAQGLTQHADAGKEIEKPFTYPQVTSEDDARAVLTEKKMSVMDLVNNELKKNARSNAYQAATLVYRPSEVPVEDIYERMRRDAIRTGLTEEQANAHIAALKAAKQASAPTATEVTE